MENYDVIVIGSGSGWLTVSIWLANAWKKVALIEKWEIWWDCTNYWCVPSKALIDIAKNWKYNDVKDVLKQVRAIRKVIQDEETIEKIQAKFLRKIDIPGGEKYWMKIYIWFASFKDKNTILINGKNELKADKIIISTWSHPIIPEFWNNSNHSLQKHIYTNENIFEIKENFENLVVVGWWYIWCELAESFANLWVKVTIIQRNIRLIPREEKEASETMEKVFKNKWIEILTNSTVEKVEENKLIVQTNKSSLRIKGSHEEWGDGLLKSIKFDKILIALWRWANIEWLNLENVWIKFDKKWIFVNRYNQTNIKNIFAIWDCVNLNPQFTHWANNEWRWVIRNILFSFIKKGARKEILPFTLYTNIEVSRVWKIESELLKKYNNEDIVSEIVYFKNNDRSKLTEDTTWFVKIIFRRGVWKILWATIVWKWAWEMLPVLTLAMNNKISAYKLSKQIFSYPTKSDAIKKVADKFVISTISNFKWEVKYFFKDNVLQLTTFIIWWVILYSFFSYKLSNNLSFEQIAIIIYNFISLNPIYWPLIYISFYSIRPIVFFPATFMTFMSWALFWLWWWLAFTMIWENLSSIFAYFLWWVFWKKIVSRWEDNWIINELKNKANKTPFMTILMTRLLFFPFDLVNYTSWFLRIRFKSFVLATIIWIIPWATVFILAWSSFYNNWKKLTSFNETIENIDVTMLLYAWILFVMTILFAKFLKGRVKCRN